MIPEIGILIAAYVVTRMIDILTRPKPPTALALFAVLTILVALFVGFDLLMRGITNVSLQELSSPVSSAPGNQEPVTSERPLRPMTPEEIQRGK